MPEFVDQVFDVLGADAGSLRASACLSRGLRPLFAPEIAAERIAHDVAAGATLRGRDRVGRGAQLVRERDRKKAAHIYENIIRLCGVGGDRQSDRASRGRKTVRSDFPQPVDAGVSRSTISGAVRAHGCITSPSGFGASEHLCWGYESEEDRLEAAVEWLDEGWWLGQRMAYVADKPVDDLLTDLAALGDAEELVGTGQLLAVPTEALYDLSAPIDAERQLAVYVATAEQAIADGFNGLRVVADITTLIEDPARRAAHARWEHVADRWVASGGRIAGMCSFDRRVVDGPAIDDICALHPLANDDPERVPFRVFAAGDTVALDGEIDGFGAERLERILATAVAPDPLIVDLAELDFVDHHGIFVLARHLRTTGARLAGVPAYVRELWRELEIERKYGVACP